MARLEKLDITRLEVSGYIFYRVLTIEDVAVISVMPDTHLFLPDELLELSLYVEENKRRFEREAKENREKESSESRTPGKQERKYPKRKGHQD